MIDVPGGDVRRGVTLGLEVTGIQSGKEFLHVVAEGKEFLHMVAENYSHMARQ